MANGHIKITYITMHAHTHVHAHAHTHTHTHTHSHKYNHIYTYIHDMPLKSSSRIVTTTLTADPVGCEDF